MVTETHQKIQRRPDEDEKYIPSTGLFIQLNKQHTKLIKCPWTESTYVKYRENIKEEKAKEMYFEICT